MDSNKVVLAKLGEKAKEVAREHVKRKAAREILTGIKEWTGNSQLTAKRRWIFELIQNATDTAKARKNSHLKIEIIYDNNHLIFKHNAGYFTLGEISATIYGGSSKPFSPESDYLGRFGTGFLVTHIINRKVIIHGNVQDNNNNIYFFKNLVINRTNDAEEGISQDIDNCFTHLDSAQPHQKKITDLWTEFIYDSNNSLGLEAIRQGIDELKKNLPFIFAFNKIDELTINGKKYTIDKNQPEKTNVIKVGERLIYIQQNEENNLQVGILIENGKILDLKNKPKLFIGMPLTETADYINIPFIINSLKFVPTKERNALDGGSADNSTLMLEAFHLYEKLVNEVKNSTEISHLFNLLNYQLIPEDKSSQNPLWLKFNEYTVKTLRNIIYNVPLVKTPSGVKIIKNTIFPIDILNDKSIGKDTFNKFYDFTFQIKKNIPIKDELDFWAGVVKELKVAFPNDVSLYTVEDIKKEFEELKNDGSFPNFEDFKKKYNLSNPKQFLLNFFKILDTLYSKKIISSSFIENLLPDQDGYIGTLDQEWFDSKISFSLHLEKKENPIPDKLKAIVEKIGRPVKQELIDKSFNDFNIIKDYVRNSMDIELVLNNILTNSCYKLAAKIENLDDLKVKGWIELFNWCIQNKKLTNNFPVITKNLEVQILEDLNKESFLIPFKYMGIDEKYEVVYPDNKLIHSKYFEIEEGQKEKFVEKLKNYKAIVITLPLYKKEAAFGYNKLKSVLCDNMELSKVDHKIDAETEIISFLPFWDGISGKISEDPERAKLLFTFIIENIVEKDISWGKTTSVKCSCKEKAHIIIPSHWLASLKVDAWIPFKTIENEKENIVKIVASKDTIKNLFPTNEFETLMRNFPNQLNKLLPHLGFDELDLNIKLQIVKTGKTEEMIRKEASELLILPNVADILLQPDIKELVTQNPSGFKQAIQGFKEKCEKVSIKDDNRKIGENVEIIIERIFSEMGFKVVPIYKGGDLELWPEDGYGWDSGLIEIEPYLVEIKFTSSSSAHLSKVQSETAGYKKEYYIVLVVENGSDLREQLKQNFDDNPVSTDLIDSIINNSHMIENVFSKLGNVPNPEEVEPDLQGYWIKRKLWTDKYDIIKWAKHKFENS